MTPRRASRFSAAVVFATLALCLASPSHAVKIGLIIDGSSSINDTEWDTLRTAAANAIRKLKTDGSVDLTVVRFGFSASVVGTADQTLSSVATRDAIANQVETMARPTFQLSPAALTVLSFAPPEFAPLIAELDFSQTGVIQGGTNFEDAIGTAVASIAMGTDAVLLNMLTDGNPTVHNGHVAAAGGPDTATVLAALNDLVAPGALTPEDAARNARDAAIAAGIDLLSFEAIGFNAQDLALMTELAHPTPGTVVNVGDPIPATTGFVINVEDFDAVEAALDAKILAFGAAVPEPGIAVLLFAGLAGLGAWARRIERP